MAKFNYIHYTSLNLATNIQPSLDLYFRRHFELVQNTKSVKLTINVENKNAINCLILKNYLQISLSEIFCARSMKNGIIKILKKLFQANDSSILHYFFAEAPET